MTRSAGFSLLELLVALAVFGLLVLALLQLAGENTRTLVVLQEQWLADVVAGNQAVEAALLAGPALAADDGSTRLGGRDWRWQRRVEPAPGDGLARVVIDVRAGDRPQVLASTELLRAVPR